MSRELVERLRDEFDPLASEAADLIERQSKIIEEMQAVLKTFAGAVGEVDGEAFIDVYGPTNEDYLRARVLTNKDTEE